MSGSTHKRIRPRNPADYLAVMSRALFQAGLSWAAIDRQWEKLCAAFDDFDAERVARYQAEDIKRILTQPGILHSERKVKATIHNAQTMVALDREHRGFRNYLRAHKNYRAIVADLKQRFSNVGEVGAYYFLFRVGERVPPFARWIRTVEGDHPRVREMVAGSARPARSMARVTQIKPKK